MSLSVLFILYIVIFQLTHDIKVTNHYIDAEGVIVEQKGNLIIIKCSGLDLENIHNLQRKKVFWYTENKIERLNAEIIEVKIVNTVGQLTILTSDLTPATLLKLKAQKKLKLEIEQGETTLNALLFS